MIVALSSEKDSHYLYIKQIIEKMGEKIFLIDLSEYPEKNAMSFRIGNKGENTHDTCLNVNGYDFSGKEIRTIWNRRKSQPVAPRNLIDKKTKEYIERESQFFIDSLHLILDCFWVSNPNAISLSALKPYQLVKAKEVGLTIPKTIISNSEDKINLFIDKENKIAVKTLCMPHFLISDSENEALILYTKKKEKSEILPLMKNACNCPTIFQEYIEKEFELRITVIGNQVFACAIYSQQSERTREDWRRYDLPNTPHKTYELPQDIKNKCLNLVRELKLVFGCIDMIVTPSGEYIFLEINPNGQWLWIEKLTDMPIGETIAKMLIAGGII